MNARDLAERIVRALDAADDRYEEQTADSEAIRDRYRRLKGRLSFDEAATRARVEWVGRALALPTGTGRPPDPGWYWTDRSSGPVCFRKDGYWWCPINGDLWRPDDQTEWAGPLPGPPWEGTGGGGS